jgi:hypothetical protein
MLGSKIQPVMFVAAILFTVHSSFGGPTSDSCRTSPGASTRAGLHWYYRTDRTNNRQCWFLNTEEMDVHSHGNVPSHLVPQHENVVEQATRPQADAVVLQVPINPSDNNVVTIATGNSFQQVVGSNSSATERQALIIKNDNTNGDSCWVFFGGDKASKEKSVILDSGGSYVRYWPFVSSEAMQATCASASDTLYVEIK